MLIEQLKNKKCQRTRKWNIKFEPLLGRAEEIPIDSHRNTIYCQRICIHLNSRPAGQFHACFPILELIRFRKPDHWEILFKSLN